MQTSINGLHKLETREGCKLRAYLDTQGIPTIGTGHTGPGVCLGLVWSQAQADEALVKDVKRCEDCINFYVAVTLAQHQFDALVSFVFNIGTNAFMHSTMLKKINQGDMEGAAKEFDRWHIPSAIADRRNSEREQFCGPS